MNGIQFLRSPVQITHPGDLFNLRPMNLGLIEDLAQDKGNGHPALVRLLLEPLEVLFGDTEGMPLLASLFHGPSFLNHPQEYIGSAKYFQSYSRIMLDIA